MVVVCYGTNRREIDLSGLSVYAARQQLKTSYDIPDKAMARLNGRKLDFKTECNLILHDEDELLFIKPSPRNLLLVLAMLLAFIITGWGFASTYTNSTITLTASISGDGYFVEVTENSSAPLSFTVYGESSGATGNGTLWDISTVSSNYTGDIASTVYLTNIDDLIHTYKAFGMFLSVHDSSGNVVDINYDGTANATTDQVFLSMENGAVNISIPGAVDVFSVHIDDGFYISQPYTDSWNDDSTAPRLYLDVSQR